MQFDTLQDFFAMGGHGLYVWLAYGSTIAVLLLNDVSLRLARRKQWRRLQWQVQVEQSKEQGEPATQTDVNNHEP